MNLRLTLDGNKTKIGIALALTCFFTNLSQLPLIVSYGLSSMISILVWGVFILYSLILYKDWKISKYISPYLLTSMVFLLFILILELFSRNSYLKSGLIYPFFLSMVMLFLASNVGEDITKKDFELIATAYIWGAFIVAINVLFEYLIGIDISDVKYAYASKNSISQIFLTACILLVAFKYNNNKKITKILYTVVSLAFVYIMLLLKSRATIIVIPILLVFLFVKVGKHIRHFRTIFIIVLFAIAIVFAIKPQLWNSLINDIILAGRGSNDLNDITSGRIDEWASFWQDMEQSWLFGQGRQKRESIILTAFLEFGLPIGFLVLSIAVSPMILSCSKGRLNTKLGAITFCIALSYCFNGIFEQLSPFGPGVKCYFLWIVLGIFLAKCKKGKIQEL